ncbi:hypothetical protein C5167_042822 [Papaver somniferum]|uniref:Uncharacterized protein n=1 Tax=Papaver somniferum TaxID=3469 RepID=A0A4Y7L790_PAPSO|nr:hypothetical protein C5167_042822 [Papaver somniferum]
MQPPMGNERPGPPNFPGRPAASLMVPAPVPTMPGPPNFPGRPTTSSMAPAPVPTMPYSSSGPTNFHGKPAAMPNGPYAPPSQVSANVGPYQRFSTPQITPPAPPMSPFGGPPAGQSTLPAPTVPSGGRQAFQPSHSPFHSQPQLSSMPMAPPPQLQSGSYPTQRGSAPPSAVDSSFPSARPNVYGYPYRQATPATPGPPPVQSPGFLGRPLAYGPPNPHAAHTNSLQHPGTFGSQLVQCQIPNHFLRGGICLLEQLFILLLKLQKGSEEVPIVNFGPTGIIRCRRCRTYVNPYVQFMDAGRKWRCNMCAFNNDVPGEYFAHLDASGRRIDMDQRPELTKGSVDFVAPTEYMVRPPMPPLYFFLIDVSISAVKSGMLEVVAKTIKSCLDELPGSPRTQIGFITYDSTLHFYNMKASFQINSLPAMFLDNVNVESAFGPALKAAFMVMNRLGGKLLIFQTTLPTLGVGRLRLRGDDLRVYGTDKEHALRIPEDPFYKQMAADLTKFQIGVNVYAFSDKYTDLASLGTLAKYTGGQVYYYPSFQAGIHKEKLTYELARDLTRETAWESVMRIRCGKGVRFTTYHGHFMLRSTDLLALPAVDSDKAFAMQLSLEENLLTNQTVYFQVALLYTSSTGERRIRVHTAAAPVVADLGEMYRQADTGAIVSVFSRLAIEKALSYKLEDARHSVQLKIVKALREYRNLYAVQHRLGGKMIYPESLKLLPLYGLALCKSVPLRGGFGDAQLDERSAAGYTMMTLPTSRLLKLLYPNLIRIDEHLAKGPANADNLASHLKELPLASESLDSRGLYVYDDGLRFVIWLGKILSPEIANNLVGVDLSGFIDLSKINLSEQDNDTSRRLMAILKRLREKDPSCYQHCHLVKQGEHPREGLLLLVNLVEDQIAGSSSYVDWMLQIHRQVQQAA